MTEDSEHDPKKFHTMMQPKLEALLLKAGDLIELWDGSMLAVVDNPRDGIWLFVTRPGSTDSSEEHSIDITEVKRIIPA